MSYSDNLENNLKALEKQEERDPVKVRLEQERRESDKKAALLRAPHAEQLKTSPFTMELLTQCRTVGHGLRIPVRFTWLGETLRIDAQERRLELAPTSEGIAAVFSLNGVEARRAAVDLQVDDAASLARRWLTEP
jgi:hypothetical protein